MKSLFRNAKIVGENVPYEVYAKQPIDPVATAADDARLLAETGEASSLPPVLAKRGSPLYIMSRGELMDFLTCPMRWLDQPADEDTESLRYGSLVDMLVLTPDLFNQQYAVVPETYTSDTGEEKPWNANSNVCKKWLAANSDRKPVKQKDIDEAEAAIERLYRDAEIKEFLNCSKKQVMVTADYTDAETGIVVPVRALTDLVPDPKHARFGKSLGDLKTSQDASLGKWRKSVGLYYYHAQAALNIDLHAAATPDVERIEFRHLIQESTPPFQTGRRILSEEFIQIGRAKYMAALKLYAKCLFHNFWPDYEIGGSVMNGWSLTEPSNWDIEHALEEVVVDFPKQKQEAEAPDADVIP